MPPTFSAKRFAAFAFITLSLSLSGCGGAKQELNYSAAARQQQTETGVRIGASEGGLPTEPSVEYVRVSMDKSIFLDPPEVDEPAVYVRVRDTSGRDWDLHSAVVARLQAQGFRITPNAAKAEHVLQANVLFANEVSAAELAKLDETEFGQDIGDVVKTAALGAAGGALAGGLVDGGGTGGIAAGAAVGGLAGAALGAFGKSEREKRLLAKQATKFYSLVVDLEVRQRAKGGVVTRQGSSTIEGGNSSAQSAQGVGDATDGHSPGASRESIGNQESESYTETTEWKRHRARILGKAKGKLIAFADVQGEFADKLARSISGMF